MRITVIALDTRGGVQPYAALALRLADDGHAVQVATFANFAPWIQELGLPVLPLTGDAEAAGESIARSD